MTDPLGAMIEQRAREIVRGQEFDAACNRVVDAGAAEFADFADALKTYQLLGDGAPTLIESALETDAPHRAIYHLAKNPDEAMRILALPPIKQAAELVRLEAKIAKPAEPLPERSPAIETQTPATEPDGKEWARQRRTEIAQRRLAPSAVAAPSADLPLTDDLPIREWMRRRAAQRRERRGY